MPKKINLAINGVGRIGRATLKIILENHKNINLVAINDLTDEKTLMNLLKYDTAYGTYDQKIRVKKNQIKIGSKNISVFHEKNPELLPWKKLKIDVVLECTGIFRTKKEASKHLTAGAKKVVISAPAKGEDEVKTIVLGVNENTIKKTDNIISCASCTTNCLSPVTQIVKDKLGVKKAIMTTVHSYTATQNLVDGPHKDLRRSRAAAQNFLPTTTGAALATTKTIPELKNKFDGMAVRVPTLVGSLIDTVYVLKTKTTKEKVKKIFQQAVKSKKYKNIVKVTNEPLVSSDIVKDPYSAIVDLEFIKLVDKDLLKVVAWYDNEWGYSHRLVELSNYIAKKI